MRLIRRRNESRLHEITESEADGRSYGEQTGDVRVLEPAPRRPRAQLRVTGEALRKAFLDRLNKRHASERPDEAEQ